MKDSQDMLSMVEANTFEEYNNRILILFDEEITLLGDCCLIFDKFRHIKAFYKATGVDINFTRWKNKRFTESLLLNNPAAGRITYNDWEDICFKKYQVVLVVSYEEEKFLEFLDQKFGEEIKNETWRVAINSVSSMILKPIERDYLRLPVNNALRDFVKQDTNTQLYITEEEELWANEWLRSQGLEEDEELVVMIDSSAVKSKLLKAETYFDVLKNILNQSKTKVLVYDERDSGKEDFYEGWLGKQIMKKLIFSKKMTLRQDISLLGASRIKMIFGPCSGLMHCASSVRNNYVVRGDQIRNIPLIVVYTGLYGAVNYNLNLWWGQSPLVDCLVLQEHGDVKKITTLLEIPEDQRNAIDRLPCSAYTKDILADYFDRRFVLRSN